METGGRGASWPSGACARRASRRTTFGLSRWISAVSSMTTTRSLAGMCAASALSSVVFPVPVPPEMRMLRSRVDGVTKGVGHTGRESTTLDQLGQREPLREFPDGQDRSRHRTWREHRGHPRAVLEAGVQQWLHLRDFVAAGARDVLDGDGQIPRFQDAVRDALEPAVALHEDALSALIHHHLGDPGIDKEILDRSKEWQDAIKAAHTAPREAWSK